jgi:hypothetical protein
VRSRPKVQLQHSPEIIVPGCTLRAVVQLDSPSETPCDGIELVLTGDERRFSHTTGSGTNQRRVYRSESHLALRAQTAAETLPVGRHDYEILFELPPDLPPSYASDTGSIRYLLAVRVSIPWWPDRTARYALRVQALAVSPSPETPGIYATHPEGPQGEEPFIEASVDRTTLGLAEAIEGAVSFGNVAQSRIKRVEVAFVALDTPTFRPRAVPTEAKRYGLTLLDHAPAENEPLPFALAFPESEAPTFRATLIDLAWVLEIRAVVAWGEDARLWVPLRVVRTAAGASRQGRGKRLPPVGRERRAEVWAAVAQARRLRNDAESETMSTELGDVALQIALERRGDAGLCCVARLSYPSLGLGLHVGEMRWTDKLSVERISLGQDKLDRRFAVRGREPAQVRSFLRPELLSLLRKFSPVSLDDEQAQLGASGAGYDTAKLDAFAGLALGVAEAIRQATAGILPPATMAADLPAWRAFAQKLEGGLELGRMAIHDARVEGLRFAVITDWTAGGVAERTRLELRFDPELEGDPRLPEAVVRELQIGGIAVEASRSGLSATLGAPVHDPSVLLGPLGLMARIAHGLRGSGVRGPYR